ncbi:DUF1353 domain-containing protein [Phenylobacterium sp.]|uniref:DUF1353 domain-containing protein n=1 Tax=Phenylobacterium sp. TaxID=1871053 RepID=UPI00286CA207|nr:DUF1353 domain-containing protein [Phenylobacterium sp.]
MRRTVVGIAMAVAMGASASWAGDLQAAPVPQAATTESAQTGLEPSPPELRGEALAPKAADGGRKERFGGKLYLVLLDDRDHPSIRGGRSLWALQQDLTYRAGAQDDLIRAPAGFVTDLASIPRWAWTLLPPDGPWVKAAVIHDFLYRTQGTGVWKGHPASIARPQPYTRAEADGILREAMADRGVGPLARNIIWAAVRVGGSAGWGS